MGVIIVLAVDQKLMVLVREAMQDFATSRVSANASGGIGGSGGTGQPASGRLLLPIPLGDAAAAKEGGELASMSTSSGRIITVRSFSVGVCGASAASCGAVVSDAKGSGSDMGAAAKGGRIEIRWYHEDSSFVAQCFPERIDKCASDVARAGAWRRCVPPDPFAGNGAVIDFAIDPVLSWPLVLASCGQRRSFSSYGDGVIATAGPPCARCANISSTVHQRRRCNAVGSEGNATFCSYNSIVRTSTILIRMARVRSVHCIREQ